MGRGGGRCWPPFDRMILQFRKAYPWGDVGFVVERGNDDVRNGRKVEDEGQIGEELGRRGTNHCEAKVFSDIKKKTNWV